MIPISCPQCGRSGKVPPDRLGSRLVCKGCQSAFHMDNGGRIVLGDPGSAEGKRAKTRPVAAAVDIDLAKTWEDIPKPAKFGVPSLILVLAGWMYLPASSAVLDYEHQAEVVGQALLNGNRSQVVALATPTSAEAAGKWFDLLHAPIAAKGAGSVSKDSVMAALLSGNPERDSALDLGVVITTDTVATNFNLPMVKAGSHWQFDGDKSLAEAERANATIKLARKK